MKTAYDIIMKAEADGIGHRLDSQMIKKKIPEYFREKYGMSYHSAATLLFIGDFPGESSRLAVEIVEEINRIQDVSVSKVFFSTVTKVAIIRHYPGFDWPVKPHIIRPEAFRPAFGGGRPRKYSSAIHTGFCVSCGDTFKICPVEHPANLCACLKCAPNGVGYGESRCMV